MAIISVSGETAYVSSENQDRPTTLAVHVLACDPTKKAIFIAKRSVHHSQYNCQDNCPVRRYCSAASQLWPKCSPNPDHRGRVTRVCYPEVSEVRNYLKQVATAAAAPPINLTAREITETMLGPALVQLNIANGLVSINAVADAREAVRVMPFSGQTQRKLLFKSGES